MDLEQLDLPIEIEDLRNRLHARGVVHASVFGSYARGDARPDSDLDILVEYRPGVSLLDHIGLRLELEALTGKSVDVVSERALSKHRRPYVERDRVAIL